MNNKSITINILGKPQAKQSFKFTRTGIRYQPKEVKESKQNMTAQIIQQLPKDYKPLTGPVIIEELSFIFPPLKSFSIKKMDKMRQWKLYKITKPDIDNLMKNLFDACNNILWLDDAQIVEIRLIKKIYNDTPGIYIKFGEIKDDKQNQDFLV